MSSETPELLKKHTVVRAGAGAGKTTRLVSEVIERARMWKQANGEWPRMVLTTFTRKATQEIRERLVLKACEMKDEELLEYLSSNAWLQISTIHGVMSLFLRRYGHLVGFDNGFTVVTEQEAGKLARRIVRDLAIENPKMSELMSLLGLKALSRLLRRLSALKLESTDLHCVNEEELRRYWEAYTKSLAIHLMQVIQEARESTDDAKYLEFTDVVEQCISDLHPATKDLRRQVALILERLPSRPRFNSKNPQLSKELHEDLGGALKKFKEQLQSAELQPEQWSRSLSWFQKLEAVSEDFHQRFFERKILQGQFEMTDLESVTVDILRSNEGLGQAFASDFDFWLIDEYQDTSPVQVELLDRLVGDSPTFIVGDPQQSIYLFRGARSEVFDQREQKVKELGFTPDVQKKNWRSDPELLLFFNEFFSFLPSDFIAMDPKNPVENVQAIVARFCPVDADSHKADKDTQFHCMAREIQRLLTNGTQPEDICILGRSNDKLFDMAQYLRRHNFPTHLHVSSGFYERREIMDAMALLRFLVNPHDNRNLILLLRSPWCRVSDQALGTWLYQRRGSYWPEMKQAEEFENDEVIRQLKKLEELKAELGVSQCFEQALIDFGCMDFSHHHDVSGRRESNFWKLVARLKEEEKKPGFSYLQFINRSFTEMDTEAGNEESDAVAALEPNHIQLMTVHASKGLQFPHVIVPNMHKVPPAARKPDLSYDESSGAWSIKLPIGEDNGNQHTVADLVLRDQRAAQEARESERVLYVALTRAKNTVFMSWVEPVKAGSWISHIPWKFEPGVYCKDNFSYEVLEPCREPVFWQRHEEQKGEVRAGWAGDTTSIRPAKRSVTSLVEEVSMPSSSAGASTSSRLVPERIKKAVEGVLVHRMMEILKTNWNFDFTDVAPQWLGDDAEKFLRAVEWVRGLNEIPLKSIVEQGEAEWGYQQLKDGSIVEGQVDLWGIADETLWIVDYKTGSQKYMDQAFLQLQIYADALKKHTGFNKVQLCVVYPMDQVCKLKNLSYSE